MRNNKRQKISNIVKAKLFIPSSLPHTVVKDIEDVLRQIPFRHININISIPRKMLKSYDGTDERTYMTAGFVRNYDPEEQVFELCLIRGEVLDSVLEFVNPIVTLNTKIRNEGHIKRLNCITKIIIEAGPTYEKPVKKETLATPADENIINLDDTVVVKDNTSVKEEDKHLNTAINIPDEVIASIKE